MILFGRMDRGLSTIHKSIGSHRATRYTLPHAMRANQSEAAVCHLPSLLCTPYLDTIICDILCIVN